MMARMVLLVRSVGGFSQGVGSSRLADEGSFKGEVGSGQEGRSIGYTVNLFYKAGNADLTFSCVLARRSHLLEMRARHLLLRATTGTLAGRMMESKHDETSEKSA